MSIKKIIEFVKNNKLLTVVVLIGLGICILLIFDAPKAATPVPKGTITYTTTKDFLVTNDNGIITVFSTNQYTQDPDEIKNTLGIPLTDNVNIVTLGTAMGKYANSQESPWSSVTPTPVE